MGLKVVYLRIYPQCIAIGIQKDKRAAYNHWNQQAKQYTTESTGKNCSKTIHHRTTSENWRKFQHWFYRYLLTINNKRFLTKVSTRFENQWTTHDITQYAQYSTMYDVINKVKNLRFKYSYTSAKHSSSS